jgi:DNA-binding PadR family transcriptional regulator
MKEMRGGTKKGELAIFETLKLIQTGLCISEIAKYRKIKRSSVYKTLHSLIEKGLISNPKRSMYELTNKGIEGLHSLVAFKYKLRQHNLHFKIKILESPKNWELKRNELRQIPYFNKTLKLKNNEQDLFNYGKLQIKTTTKSVIIKVPTIYAEDWEHAIIQAMSILEDAIYKIEKLFKIFLIKDYKSNITIISQEYAKIQDALAKTYRNEGNRLYLTGDDGKIWLITDLSFSTDETEFIHAERATDDLDAVAPFLNDLRRNPTTMSDIKDVIKDLVMVQVADKQNINKHQKVLDEMLITMKKIQEKLDKL